MSTTHEKERTLTKQIEREVATALPGVEVLAVELAGPDRFTVFVDHADGVDHALCARVTDVLRDYLSEYAIDVSSPGKLLDGPRWVSTKAAFGWHALMPSEYTKKAIDFVAPAYDPRKGWASGVTEDSRQSTKSWDVNTAAVLLEIAHYQLRGGKPLIETAAVIPE